MLAFLANEPKYCSLGWWTAVLASSVWQLYIICYFKFYALVISPAPFPIKSFGCFYTSLSPMSHVLLSLVFLFLCCLLCMEYIYCRTGVLFFSSSILDLREGLISYNALPIYVVVSTWKGVYIEKARCLTFGYGNGSICFKSCPLS